jgi:RHS repeat-associated protein
MRGNPTGRTIATRAIYSATGTINSTSLPYFEASEAPRWTTFAYDWRGRVVSQLNPDGARALACHGDLDGVAVTIDANNHRRRESRDLGGRLVQVEEYRGTFASCTLEAGSPYATTLYSYDHLSRLRQVMNAVGSPIVIDYDTVGRRIASSDPDLGNWTYAYWPAGNLRTQTDGRGNTITFYYDPLNRLRTKDYPTGVDVSYDYDAPNIPFSKGRLTSMTDGTGSTTVQSYDSLGRATSVTKWIGNQSFTTGTQFDGAGRVWKITYPDGTVVTNDYDTDGNLWHVKDTARTYGTFEGYNALGQVGNTGFGTTGIAQTQYTYYSSNSRLQRILTTYSQGQLDLRYGYDGVGNMTSITNDANPAESTTFVYDGLNRLRTSATSSSKSCTAYDPIGNITWKSGVSYTLDPIKVHQVTATTDGRTYTYDDNGNMRSDGTRVVTWEYDNRPSVITVAGVDVTLSYDGNGARVKKVTPATTILYASLLYECETPAGGAQTCRKHIFGPTGRIASVTPTEATYYHADHLGSTRVVTDAAGVELERISYNPFGATTADTAPDESHHKYTGHESDAETGLYYHGARYYNPALGRFISADSIIPDLQDPQLLNRYSYVRNNPLTYVDPTGQSPVAILDLITYVGGGTVAAVAAPVAIVAGTAIVVDSIIEGRSPRDTWNSWTNQHSWKSTAERRWDQATGWLDERAGWLDERADKFGAWLRGASGADWRGTPAGVGGSLDASLSERVRIPDVDVVGDGVALSVLRAASDVSSGFGDFITVGATRWVREDLTNTHVVDYNSGWYRAGEVAGAGWAGATTMGMAPSGPLWGARGWITGRGIGLLNSNDVFRIGYTWNRALQANTFRIAIGSQRLGLGPWHFPPLWWYRWWYVP